MLIDFTAFLYYIPSQKNTGDVTVQGTRGSMVNNSLVCLVTHGLHQTHFSCWKGLTQF